MKKICMQITTLILAGFFVLGLSLPAMAPLFGNFGKPILEQPLPDEDAPAPEVPPNADEPPTPEAPEQDPAPPVQLPEEPTPPEEDKPLDPIYIRSLTDGLTVRSGAGTNYAALGHINKGDMVHFVAKKGNWYETVYKSRRAYISAASSFTELYTMEHKSEAAPEIEAVIAEGLQLLGFVYVYGAIRLHDGKGNLLKNFDATKYDCSSLMQYIFYHGADIHLQMTTRTQVKQGRFVAKSKIARGDLLFFTNSTRYNKTGTERIGHVALYLGDNYILHTASDYAVIEPISSTRWGYYIEARRMI